MMKQTKELSILLPCYNEEDILEKNVGEIVIYLDSLYQGKWEIIIINDGSSDNTKVIADKLSQSDQRITVVHHHFNMNLGHAIRTGFKHANGEIIVVLDIDLSYSVSHIEKMVETLKITYSDMVVASPYMKGGKNTAVPFFRLFMSRGVNWFMRIAAQDKYYTFTGMVRAYRREFIQVLNLKTKDYEINPEIMYKAMILRARIVEIPAHLDWSAQNQITSRGSSLRVIRAVFSGIMSGFIFRPYIFFISIGFITFLLSMFPIVLLFFDTIVDLSLFANQSGQFSRSLALQFNKNPHSFIVGGTSLLVSIQFLGLGFLSLQNKRYFEELFHFETTLLKNQRSFESKDIEE